MIQFAQDMLQKIENEIAQVCSDDMVSLEQTSCIVNFIKPLLSRNTSPILSKHYGKHC